MKKLVKLGENISIFLGTDEAWAKENGFEEKDVEQGYDGAWYLLGEAPIKPAVSYKDERTEVYPSIEEQLDMIYWDKVNDTTVWEDLISNIKSQFPKT